MLIPTNYEQYVEVRRQQETRRQDERSPEYQRLLDDLDDSIEEWRVWRHDHPAPGTMATLVANAYWLTPLCVAAQVIFPLLLRL